MNQGLIISWDIDKDGNIDVHPLTNMWGLLMEEDVLDAIVEACKKDKQEMSQEERRAYNQSIVDKFYSNNSRSSRSLKEVEPEKHVLKCQIYVIKDSIREVYKIGRGVCAKKRFKGLKTANPGIELIAFYDGVESDETYLHSKFKDIGSHVDGEWFRLDDEDLEEIKSYFSVTIDDFPF